MKEYCKPQWFRNSVHDLIYFPGGELEAGLLDTEEACKAAGIELVVVPWRAYTDLKEWMLKHDPDRIVASNRDEDLKLINRLVDIIEKQVAV
jgi:hypothetical protein